MPSYTPPIQDILFTLTEVAGLERVAQLPGCEGAAADVVAQVLESAGQLASEIIAPLNAVGDKVGSVLENGVVRTPPGFREAYAAYVAGGWNAMPFDPAHGGQGLPWTVVSATQEMWQSASLAFGLCPVLNFGAVELLQAHASPAQKSLYLPNLISGTWTATMNLTEPQAGSDVGAIRTRAVPAGDGTYKITGQKIFITYGDHDLTENIVHLVLARLPDAPAGTRGISLFLVPKFRVAPDGSLKERNDLRVVSLEHKLGIHASPTAVMAYGDNGGAIGELVGEANNGLACMFTMMNNARLTVGIQGVAVAERAYQLARDYARTRVQGRDITGQSAGSVPIIRHPDVRRMLMTMRALAEAGRALIYSTAASLDVSQRHPDPAERQRHQARLDLLIPVLKAWCTDAGVEAASLGVQVHGGMGYIEETGAAQLYRDSRIAPIYEGTNGIQANDLVFRKLGRDGGAAAAAFIAEVEAVEADLSASGGGQLATLRSHLMSARKVLQTTTRWMVDVQAREPQVAAAAAAHYLRLFGLVAGGALLGRGALAAHAARGGDSGFLAAKITTACFFAEHLLALAPALLDPIVSGAASTLALPEDRF
jgi:alkylation response protein AidB-like acyl-CoA dehydrogenase